MVVRDVGDEERVVRVHRWGFRREYEGGRRGGIEGGEEEGKECGEGRV